MNNDATGVVVRNDQEAADGHARRSGSVAKRSFEDANNREFGGQESVCLTFL
jgi:hypothetical protein